MSPSTRVIRGPRWASSHTARTTVTIIAAALALPATAFGGGPSSAAFGGPSNVPGALSEQANTQKALAYSRCMRAHGVRNWPDPEANGNGVFPKRTAQQLGVSSAQLEAAQRACQELLPNGGQPTAAALQQSWSDFLKFAQCMRRHGVSNWPDPTRYPQHPDRPYFDLQRAGIDPSSPRVTAKIDVCLPLLHGTNPQHLGGGGSG
jgi:hypothetical protein